MSGWVKEAICGANSHLTGDQRQQLCIPAMISEGFRPHGQVWPACHSKRLWMLPCGVIHKPLLSSTWRISLPRREDLLEQCWWQLAQHLKYSSTAFDMTVVLCLIFWATIIHSIYLRFMSSPSMQHFLFNIWSSDFWKYFFYFLAIFGAFS